MESGFASVKGSFRIPFCGSGNEGKQTYLTETARGTSRIIIPNYIQKQPLEVKVRIFLRLTLCILFVKIE